jgi:hypothetical protein
MKKNFRELFGYKNTKSEAGSPERVLVNLDEVRHATVWVNYYGNPSYMLYLENGDTLFLVDEYGIDRSCFSRSCVVRTVSRKKDL